MVVTDLPSTMDTGVAQARVACPSMCTVQAPHDAMPQPNLVPVSLRCSRRTQSSGVLGSTPSSLRTPLTVKATMRSLHLSMNGSGFTLGPRGVAWPVSRSPDGATVFGRVIRDGHRQADRSFPDYASLHPGYRKPLSCDSPSVAL